MCAKKIMIKKKINSGNKNSFHNEEEEGEFVLEQSLKLQLLEIDENEKEEEVEPLQIMIIQEAQETRKKNIESPLEKKNVEPEKKSAQIPTISLATKVLEDRLDLENHRRKKILICRKKQYSKSFSKRFFYIFTTLGLVMVYFLFSGSSKDSSSKNQNSVTKDSETSFSNSNQVSKKNFQAQTSNSSKEILDFNGKILYTEIWKNKIQYLIISDANSNLRVVASKAPFPSLLEKLLLKDASNKEIIVSGYLEILPKGAFLIDKGNKTQEFINPTAIYFSDRYFSFPSSD